MEIDFKEIDKARKILGLEKKATLREIKNAYREKAKMHHPDSANFARNKEECDELMKKVNDAYNTLIEYCENYVYSFKKEDVEDEEDAYMRYMKSFENDWLWSRRDIKNETKK